jgi:hypothetical protein
MKRPFTILVLAVSVITGKPQHFPAPTDKVNHVYLTAAATESPQPKVTLNYTPSGGGQEYISGYTIYRKVKGSSEWGPLGTAAAQSATFEDTTVAMGTAYEYRVIRHFIQPDPIWPVPDRAGYVVSGVRVLPTHSRGKVILLVDSTLLDDSQLASKIVRLESDLTGDGWTVLRRDVARTESVVAVKAIIKADYDADPANVKAVFLLGGIAIPYSGDIAPDGHVFPSPCNHLGAWPADVFYGEVTSPYGEGGWSDEIVNSTTDTLCKSETHNVPADGKFDQTRSPSTVELQVGRVDLRNMSQFYTSLTEPERERALLRRYLDKDHNFRHKAFSLTSRALVSQWFSDGVTRTWQWLPNLVPQITDEGQPNQWFNVLGGNSYLWAVASGPGGFTGAQNIGTTADFASTDTRCAFTLLFGSFFGDWDYANSFLRAPLCTATYTLASFWHGRPSAPIFYMALGDPIGEVARRAYEFEASYEEDEDDFTYGGQIHTALMGDPTLRMHVVAPPTGLGATRVNPSSPVQLAWTRSAEDDLQGTIILGYEVYRAPTVHGPFTSIASLGPVASYQAPAHSDPVYMVRARKFEAAQTGTYLNLSEGTIASISGVNVAPIILTQPIGRAVTAGKSAAFTVKAVGIPNVSYQWQKSGVNLTDGPNVVGATSPALVIRSVASGDVGNYRVLASNSGGSVTSASVPLALNQGPIAVNDEITINQDTPIDIDVLSNDYDPDQTPGALSLASIGFPSLTSRSVFDDWAGAGFWGHPANGKIEILEGLAPRIRYIPYPGFFGTDSFEYTISDGETSSLGTVTITVNDTSLASSLPNLSDSDIQYQYGADGASRVSPDGTWKITGCCALGRGDNGHFSWRNHSGDFELIARVQNDFHVTEGRVGVMIREGTGLDARFAFVGVSSFGPGSGAFRRSYWLDPLTGDDSADGDIFLYPNGWVRLRRIGNQVTLFTSTDGRHWSQFGDPLVFTNPALSQTLAVGLFAARGYLNEADHKFYNVITDFQINKIFVEDGLPPNAVAQTAGGDSWNWQAINPTPYSGTLAHHSSSSAGYHYHGFDAAQPFYVNADDVLFTYVYLDPANLPSEVMLEWSVGGNWEHRAYWGANLIAQGTDGTASRRYMGLLPPSGQWTRLEILASTIGLTDNTGITGIRFSLYGGKAVWDHSGKSEFAWRRPLVLTNSALLADGRVVFQVHGGFNGTVATVESSSDLVNWSTLSTATITGGFASFENQTTGIGRRFYRAYSGNLKSVNAIGLTRLSIPAGWSMYANQLIVGDQTPGSIFAFSPVPDNCELYIENPLFGGYHYSTYLVGSWWGDSFDIPAGKGGWIYSPSAFEARVLGVVPLNTVRGIPKGWSFQAAALPREQAIATALSFPVQNNDQVYIYQPASGTYDVYEYITGLGWWESEPICPIGQAFQVYGNNPNFRTWVIRHTLWP